MPAATSSMFRSTQSINWSTTSIRLSTDPTEGPLAAALPVGWERLVRNNIQLQAALLSPGQFRDSLPEGASFGVIWDSGASISVSSSKDFVDLKPPPEGMALPGIARRLEIEGVGHVVWAMMDTQEMWRAIKLPAFFVPERKVRLMGTTSLLQTYQGEHIHQESTHHILSGRSNDPSRAAVLCSVNKANNILATGTCVRLRRSCLSSWPCRAPKSALRDGSRSLASQASQRSEGVAEVCCLSIRQTNLPSCPGTKSTVEGARWQPQERARVAWSMCVGGPLHQLRQWKRRNAMSSKFRDVGVIPQEYRSDNGSAFTSRQIRRFAGVGAHPHNGVAENGIRTVTTSARGAQ